MFTGKKEVPPCHNRLRSSSVDQPIANIAHTVMVVSIASKNPLILPSNESMPLCYKSSLASCDECRLFEVRRAFF